MKHNRGYAPVEYTEALQRLNLRQQKRNKYTNISRAMVLREIRNKKTK